MAYRFAQVRYNQDGSDMSNTVAADMISGRAFSSYNTIFQLGIQAPPGTIFYINGSDSQVIVGSSGVFELNLLNKASISALRFDAASINFIRENNNSFIIVDILYAGEGG